MKSFVPPIEVQANARRALEVRSQKPPSERGMVEEGLARARDLANGRALSIDTIRRMSSFFARHEIDKQGSTWSTYGKGWQAWMGWGGDAGRRWARRILAYYDKPSSSKKGTAIQKDGPAMPQGQTPQQPPASGMPANYAAEGGQRIVGDLGRDESGRFANMNPGQGQAMPPASPQQAGQPPQQPLQDLYAQYGNNLLENLGNGRYKDRRTGQEFTLTPSVPKDEQKQKNAQDTEKFLESSGLKAVRSVLEQLAIGATEGITPDTRNRLFMSGLANVTPAGMQISQFGKQFLSVINANQDIAAKEMKLKEALYNAELYRKNELLNRMNRGRNVPVPPSSQRVPNYLQRVRKGIDMNIQKNDASFQDDAQGNDMALRQLRAISDKASQLSDMMENDNVGLEAWQQSKVTSASDDIGAVFDSIMYSSTEKVQKNQKTFGGIPREKLRDSDFVFSDERKFPIVTPRDVPDAVSSWGRYKGNKTFDEFRNLLMDVVRRKGDDFVEALPESWKEEAVIAKNMSGSSFFKFATFMKGDPEQRIVVGYASSERIDGQNDIVDSEALNQALSDYMQWANLREMHQPKAVGKVLQATPVRGTIQLKDGSRLVNPLRITAQIIDNETWEKVKTGVLKGFSIGGKVLQALTEKMNGKDIRRITGLQLHEISLVDRPANPDARIVLLKRDETPTDDTAIQKAAQTDPTKILPQIQQLRNQAEMDGDLEQAERYNEVISLMLEAMGILPQGTMRATEEVESGEMPNANPMNAQPNQMGQQNQNSIPGMPDDMGGMGGMPGMMSMDDVYAYNPSFQQTANVAYSQMPDDLQKAGRTISAATAAQLDQIMQAVQFIVQQVEALKQQGQPQQPPMPQGQPPMPPDMMGGMPPQGQPPMPPDMQAVPSGEVPAPVESAMPQIQPTMQPQQPPTSMAPSPETMAMLRGIGNPVLAASQQTGDLSKSGTIDLARIEEEVKQMEQMTENSAPPAEAMEGTPATEVATDEKMDDVIAATTESEEAELAEVGKAETGSNNPETTIEKSDKTAVATPSIDVDAITKSLTSIIASQLEGINKQIERIEVAAKEQHTSLFDTVNPLASAINDTKAAVEPLVEKVSKLEPLVEKVDELAHRIETLENTPVGNTPVLRGTAVNKALGGSAAADSQPTPADELTTLYKMIDETENPLVRTKLREQAALLEARKIFS